MFSFVIPWASHTDHITNHNHLGSSFPTPLNVCSLISLTILTFGGGGVAGGVDGFDEGDVGGGMDEGGISGKHSLINQTMLPGENLLSSFSLSREIEAKGLFSTPPIP